VRRANVQSTTMDGRKWYVETKRNVFAPNGTKYEKGIFPQSEAFEIGGHRIILPNGETTFLFYSDCVRNFAE
jgi:hypothetical protein